MPDDVRMTAVFDRLTDVFAPHRPPLVAKKDDPGNLYLETPPSRRYPDGFYFGAVKVGKRYVSFHLMPVYTSPELLDGISPELRKRMQGKFCFNFTRLAEALVSELKALTATGFAWFQAEGIIPAGPP